MTRFTSRALAAATALALAGCAAATADAKKPAPDIPPPTDKPNLNMSRALLAAQIDPGRPDTAITPGSKVAVIRIERLLRRRGLLARQFVDGHYGSSTKSAYSAFQQRLGYSGLAANGLPGIASLTQLAGARFDITGKVNVGPRVQLPGTPVINRRTNRMKIAAAKLLRDCKWVVSQGSYNPGGVSQSAGTHDGGGAMDVSVTSGCGTRPNAVRALRTVGFAAWYRPTIPGLWDKHIHAIAVNDTDLAAGAADQVSEYYRGFDGLSGDGRDTGPQVPKHTWEWYKAHR
ncbi:MAG: peptidoglycan-binding domain-containing protein [Solirubrobacteraceae bacterium]